MKNIHFFILFLVSIFTYSQEVKLKGPNYKTIKKNILKEGSNLFYKDLMQRYKNSDTTMTLEEKRHLYYGYVHHIDYSPYGSSDYEDSLKVLLKEQNYDFEQLNKIKRFADSALVDKPFDLRVLSYSLYANDQLKRVFDLKAVRVKANIIIDAILSSGDGLKKKTAFYVTNVSHEYQIIAILGYQFGGSQNLIEHYDYLELAENNQGIEGFYFDVSPCLNSLSGMFKD